MDFDKVWVCNNSKLLLASSLL